jgi:arylsulfatase A-like enzyme
VVYASDQGFYLGEHGWFDKRWIFEESLRTPLLVRWPGVTKAGTVSKDLVSNGGFRGDVSRCGRLADGS